jgi:hypothetical protein
MASQRKPARAAPISGERSSPAAKSPDNAVLRLQQTIGNRGVRRLLGRPSLQSKLTVSHPGDVYERQADRVADAVMRMTDRNDVERVQKPGSGPGEQISRQPQEEKEWDSALPLQRKPAGGAASGVSPGVESSIISRGSGGQPLPDAVRDFFEPRFGQDFSDVRVHTGSKSARSARELDARAFTVGRNIVMGAGQYSPGTSDGRQLLAHELTHVIQQRSNTAQAKEMVQRWSFGSGAAPHGDYIEVPADEQARITRAMNIVGRVADNPTDFPGCRRFFRDNCPGGSNATLKNVYDNAVMWKDTDATILGSQVDPSNIAYTDLTYRVGHWAMGATFVHELIHVCGQASHDIGDQAKGVCGRLPNI